MLKNKKKHSITTDYILTDGLHLSRNVAWVLFLAVMLPYIFKVISLVSSDTPAL